MTDISIKYNGLDKEHLIYSGNVSNYLGYETDKQHRLVIYLPTEKGLVKIRIPRQEAEPFARWLNTTEPYKGLK